MAGQQSTPERQPVIKHFRSLLASLGYPIAKRHRVAGFRHMRFGPLDLYFTRATTRSRATYDLQGKFSGEGTEAFAIILRAGDQPAGRPDQVMMSVESLATIVGWLCEARPAEFYKRSATTRKDHDD